MPAAAPPKLQENDTATVNEPRGGQLIRMRGAPEKSNELFLVGVIESRSSRAISQIATPIGGTVMQNVLSKLALVSAVAGVMAATFSFPATAQSTDRIETGLLECSGQGGWGLILGSQKTMRCTFTSLSGKPLGFYDATVTKFGLDIGKTGQTSMVWAVFAPATASGDNYVVGSLEGDYVGVAAEASAGVGLGANALVGGGQTSFALQPVSVKAQTGINIAAGVETFNLQFTGPATE